VCEQKGWSRTKAQKGRKREKQGRFKVWRRGLWRADREGGPEIHDCDALRKKKRPVLSDLKIIFRSGENTGGLDMRKNER